ncbi:MAG: LuxR C-terminal-related transcriptional regulator [Marinomonas foliarum]|uniref:LuxR family two component transcriptional regulator n=1 Tax=Marinomonas foliarum TaxID=491950 RepID=A0A369A286_9GAMM|nr:response regulator transcription factor [Marinomonas foliarum]QRV23509.1 response regulator transcription factor [Marinomonas foliarum]RCX03430.1 LuxR family two component transcriptional regulator [Marinomonas foliarum]
MISLVIADDHPLFRSALSGALRAEIQGIVIVESFDLDSTIQCLSRLDDLDLLLLDLNMPGSGELYGLIRIRKDFPDVPVAVISGSEDSEMVAKVIDSGALGFIPKTSEPATYVQAIHAILAGDIWLPDDLKQAVANQPKPDLSMQNKVAELTPQQYKVLCYLHEGLLNKQIAYELSISEATVKAHITAIFRKLEINNRTQAVLVASDLKLQMTTTMS